MSQHFNRVKKKMEREIASLSYHTPESWSDIMLRNTSLLQTDEDQEAFFNWILNPSDSMDYKPPEFKTVNPNEPVKIQTFHQFNVTENDDEKECEVEVACTVDHQLNGMTSYLSVKPSAVNVD